ncbi:MAG: CDP-glycerol glycerophosphotransferase family protein [Alphaproteobacteria bacterium]|nr:CDP-glycerol glycerophosphotransferase family protein [Alphaproteobacteria bacterium]
MTNDNQNSSIEARFVALEQAIGLIVEAQKNAVAVTQETAKKAALQERSAAALRIRRGFEEASKIYPKSRTVIFVARECGGDGRVEYFGDNIKYAYLAFLEKAHAEDAACYFLTDSERLHKQLSDAGLPCLPWFVPDWTAEHMRILLSAKTAVLCNLFYPVDERGFIPWALLRGAKFIQLWHGIPLKAIGMEQLYPAAAYHPRIAEVLGASGLYDVLVGTAKAQQGEWARRFPSRHYAPIGYPRNDALFREPSAHDMINVDVESYKLVESAAREGKKVILYAPTFRDGEFGTWFQRAGMEAVAEHCHARGYILTVNLHPFEGRYIEEFRGRYPRIYFIAPLTDIYPLLRHVNIFVTDYSSLAFDFLLLDRPIIFYRPDHTDYIAKSRPLIARHEDYLCGDVAQDTAVLIKAIDAATSGNDARRAARQALRQKLYDHADGKAAERLNQLILEALDSSDIN